MSIFVQPVLDTDEVDVLAGALYAWCAERSTKLKSQAGLAAASKAIDLYNAGYRSQDRLLSALHEMHAH
ncbi:hypothetical protein [Rhizobium sp. HT1-10]|uniref:hypothetical protein n=1 Tax=Rhizobium sp. HT1-10 TaxID=3111638 RepID=UPI003C170601